MACGDVDRKGGFADVKTRGLDGPRKEPCALLPLLSPAYEKRLPVRTG